MTYNTINNDVTMPGGESALLASRYRIIKQLGQGGMGSVWLAEDTQLDNKQFAIKMLPSILVSNKRAYRQLKDEALVAMKLTHSNIVTLRAFEENNGNPFLVMDYIDGQTLDDYLAEKGKLSEDETIKLLKPVAAALDYAHGEGVVHRDVKPANIMIRKDGHPYILDFGIAREIQETMTRVTGKLSSGTLLYMSPEQLNGEPPKSAQDVYSFAAMVYECLKGEPPFSRGQIEHQILNNMPPPLAGASVSLSCSIMSGLAKEPDDRPPTCAAVLQGRKSCAEAQRRGEVGVDSAPDEKDEGGTRSKGSLGKVIGVLALLLVLAGGGAWWWTHQNPPPLRGKASVLSGEEELAKLNAPLHTDDEKPAALNAGLGDKPTQQKPNHGASSSISGTEGSGESMALAPDELKPPTWEETQKAINDCVWKVDLIRSAIASKMDEVKPFRSMPGDFSDIITMIDDDWKRLKELPEPKSKEDAKSQPGNASDIAKAIDERIKSLDMRRTFYINQSLENARKIKDSSLQDKWERCIAECDKVLGWDAANDEANKLKADAEGHLVPSATIVAKIGSRVVADAKIEHQGKKYGLTFSNLRGRNTLGPYRVVYDENGKHYEGTLSATPVWESGHRDIPVTLMLITRPRHGDVKTLTLSGGATMEMVYVAQNRQNNGYWIGSRPVTQEQWKRVMNDNPSSLQNNHYPVVNVSWDDCQSFLGKLSARARLPYMTEVRNSIKDSYLKREWCLDGADLQDVKVAYDFETQKTLTFFQNSRNVDLGFRIVVDGEELR